MDNNIVRRMVEVIESNYAQSVTLRTLSSAVGRQPAYLGRLFRQEVGATARDYLTRVRLEKAAALIRDGVKIEAVALSVGYRSKKNFYQQFRKHYGTTPVVYRGDVIGGTRPEGPSETPTPVSADDQRTEAEPLRTFGTVAAIVRASNRAWRLAVQAQRLMVEHFNRFRMALLLTNEEGRYVGANRAAMSVTGYSASELQALAPSTLFVEPPVTDVRCVWQLVMVRHSRPDQPANASLRTKAGQVVGVHVVTLRNFLWGRSELSALLAR